MHFKCLLFVVALCLSYINTTAQNNDIVYSYGKISFSSNLDSLEKITLENRDNPNVLLKTYLALEVSRLSFISYKQGEAIDVIDSLCEIVNSEAAWATSALLKSKLLYKGKFSKEQCLVFAYNALPIFEKLKDTTGILSVYSSLINLNINSITNALNGDAKLVGYYVNQVDTLSKLSNNPIDKIYRYSLLSFYYSIIKQNKKLVIDYCNQGLALCKQYPKLAFMEQTYYVQLADVFSEMGDIKAAIFYNEQALKHSEPTQAIVLSYINSSLLSLYSRMHQYKKATMYGVVSIEQIKKFEPKNYVMLSENYKEIADNYQKLGNLNKAWHYILLSDSLHTLADNTEKNNLLIESQTKYQTERKEQELQAIKEQQKQLLFLLVVGSIVLIIIITLALLLVANMRKLRSLNQFKEKVLSIISHDLQSPLLALQDLNSQASYLLQTQQLHKFDQLAQLIDNASTQMSLLLNNLLLWAVSKNTKQFKQQRQVLLQAIVNQVIGLYAHTAASKQVKIINTVSQEAMLITNVQILELIMRNWLDNTLKHANASVINFGAVINTTTLELLITDDGNIPSHTMQYIQRQLSQPNALASETAAGLGLTLIAYFAKIQNWQIKLTNIGNTNQFIIIIPR